jgi:ABC-type nitrate/sulfonate/bicarbonate transport system permease component
VADRRLAISTASVAAFLVAWELAPRLGVVDPFFTSRPSLVLAAAVDVVRSGTLLQDAIVSLSEFAIGFALAVAVGVPLGLLLGTFDTLRFLLEPPIMAVYATPQLALLPIFVLWLGIGMASKVAVVFLGASIPVIVNSMAGVRHVERSLVVAARSFGATRFDLFGKVILPASLPAVMIGIRLGLSRGVLGVVVAEMYVSQDGVGNQIMRLGSAFRVDRLLVYVLLVSTFGLVATNLVRAIEARIAR